MSNEDRVLTTGEAAGLCGVSRSTLRRAVAQGHLAAWHTPGRHLRFSEAACFEFALSLGRSELELVGRRYDAGPPISEDADARRPQAVRPSDGTAS